jgi:mannose-6-phosphate isomerase-like protein (cupin superfamily)
LRGADHSPEESMEGQPLNIASSTEEMRQSIAAQSAAAGPTFFHLRARLPKQGRTDTPLAATDRMWVVLKTYANDGENELHAHPNEDHVFLVLQGRAVFYGPQGEERHVQKYDGILLPRGTFYWFKSVGDEPLIMARVGAVVDAAKDPLGRIDGDGKPMDGYSAANKQTEVILHEDRWFE